MAAWRLRKAIAWVLVVCLAAVVMGIVWAAFLITDSSPGVGPLGEPRRASLEPWCTQAREWWRSLAISSMAGERQVCGDDSFVFERLREGRATDEDRAALGVHDICSAVPLQAFLVWTTDRASFLERGELHRGVLGAFRALHARGSVVVFSDTLTSADVGGARVEPLDVASLVLATPLEAWWRTHPMAPTDRFYFSHVTDVVRLAVLFRRGGLWLDFDAVVVRPLCVLRNVVGRQRRPASSFSARSPSEDINGAVMAFDAGHPFLWRAMERLAESYRPDLWEAAGPGLLTHLLSTSWPSIHLGSSDDTTSPTSALVLHRPWHVVAVLPPVAFYLWSGADLTSHPALWTTTEPDSDEATTGNPTRCWEQLLARISHSETPASSSWAVHLYGQVVGSRLATADPTSPMRRFLRCL